MLTRKGKSLNGFKSGSFVGRFPSDGAARMAVKGLRYFHVSDIRDDLTIIVLTCIRSFLFVFCFNNLFAVNKQPCIHFCLYPSVTS